MRVICLNVLQLVSKLRNEVDCGKIENEIIGEIKRVMRRKWCDVMQIYKELLGRLDGDIWKFVSVLGVVGEGWFLSGNARRGEERSWRVGVIGILEEDGRTIGIFGSFESKDKFWNIVGVRATVLNVSDDLFEPTGIVIGSLEEFEERREGGRKRITFHFEKKNEMLQQRRSVEIEFQVLLERVR